MQYLILKRSMFKGSGLKSWVARLLGSMALGIGEVVGAGGAIALCPSQLPSAIEPILNRAEFDRARWGIEVQTLATDSAAPTNLYSKEAREYLVPASNVKLFTTAAALAHLGPGFRAHTSVYGVSEPSGPDKAFGGTELRVVGQGDPTLTTERLLELSQQLQNQGIQQVDRLVIDNHYFQGSPFNPTWEWEDVQSGYGAPVNSLILNQNEIVVNLYPQAVGQPLRLVWANLADSEGWRVVNRSVTVRTDEPTWIRVGRDLGQPILYIDGQLHPGSNRDISAVSIPKPTEYFSQQFRSALNQAGISADSIVIEDDQGQSSVNIESRSVLASLPSPSMPEWLKLANRDSNNLATESLLLQIGASGNSDSQAPDRTANTLALALSQLGETLSSLGIDPTGYSIADGSGLSRRNLVSPVSLVETLQAMANHPWADIYRESLAIAATSGTLRYRFRDTPVAGNLYGKSGGLTGVASLSGYLYPPDYSPLVFSIILNHSTQTGRINRGAIDDIVLTLAQLEECQ
ncbi:MAG: D-alanyl-D-alanine carboxypeptidase/D-alanyl-D-alanine-endopeptidase [Cyanobacteria bacterium P01_F01_bin.150]